MTGFEKRFRLLLVIKILHFLRRRFKRKFKRIRSERRIDRGENKIKHRYGIVNFERRKYPRFSIDLPIEYYRPESSIAHPGRTDNVSEGGLLIYLPEKVEVGEHLKLRLFFASISESLHTMEVMAEVAWVRSETSKIPGDHPCGVKLIDIDPTDMNKLKGFLKSLTQ